MAWRPTLVHQRVIDRIQPAVGEPQRRAPLAVSTVAQPEIKARGAALSKIIGLSKSTVSRVSTGARSIMPDTKEGELAALLVRICGALDTLVGHEENRRMEWLPTYNDALSGAPKELMQSVQGPVQVATYLDGLHVRN